MGVIRRLARRLLLLGLAVLLLTIGAVMLLSERMMDRHAFGRSIAEPVDAAIVLGGGIDGDGVIGYSTRRRVLAAVEALKQGKARRLIVTGGPLFRGSAVTVADLMAEHAMALGAPEGAVIREERAGTTFENLRFSFALADERGLGRLALVSDAYHLARAKALAAYFGHPEVELVAAPGLRMDSDSNRISSILREAMAWWYNVLKVAAWEGLGLLGLGESERAEFVR